MHGFCFLEEELFALLLQVNEDLDAKMLDFVLMCLYWIEFDILAQHLIFFLYFCFLFLILPIGDNHPGVEGATSEHVYYRQPLFHSPPSTKTSTAFPVGSQTAAGKARESIPFPLPQLPIHPQRWWPQFSKRLIFLSHFHHFGFAISDLILLLVWYLFFSKSFNSQ